MKLLIARVGALGDVLHALPAVAALREVRPDWTLHWAVDPRWSPLLVNGSGTGPLVERVHLAETRLWSRAPLSRATLQSILELRRGLRREHLDLGVDLQGTLRSGVLAHLSGAARVCGWQRPREHAAALFYRDKYLRQGTHVVEQNAALLSEATGLALKPATSFPLPMEPWAGRWAEDLTAGRRICVLAAGGGWAAKHWPIEHYGTLAGELGERGYTVLANAPRKDDPVAGALVRASGGAAKLTVCNVAGLVALLRRTALLVGGDSGPTHLAAALGVPLVALFGPTDPARNGPWGPGPRRVLRDSASLTSYHHVETPDPGLARIAPAQVLAAIEEVSAEGARTSRPAAQALPPR